MNTTFSRLVFTFAIAASLSACGTLTDSIGASSETFTNSTESSSRVTSSKAGEHASLKSQQAIEFAKVNWMQLSANMANGQGEHLSTMADLMGVKPAQKPAFYSMTKAKFSQLFTSIEITPEQLVSRLQVEVTKLNKA